MRILLTTLNSKYVHSNLALKYLYASAVTKCDFLAIKEFTINQEEDYIFTELLREPWDAICFSCYIWNMEKSVDLAENIKKARPDVKIIFGGPEVSYETVEFLKGRKSVDFVVTGEGEQAFGSLCRMLSSGEERYEKIKGLVYRKDGKIFVNPAAEALIFESVPFPYDLLPLEKEKVVYYESARGCPFQCSYCLSSLDKKMRALSLSRVYKELNYFIENRVKQVKFVDRTFNWDKARCMSILSHIMRMDAGITNFHFELCGELIDVAFLELMEEARPGLFQFEIGIQSVHADTLAAVERNANVQEALAKAEKLARLTNVHLHLDLIAGLPHEDYRSFQESFNAVYALHADTFQLGFLKLLKGTKIRQEAQKYEYVYRRKAPYEVIGNQFISARDMARLKQIEEILELYYNRGGFSHTLSYITEALSPSPFAFYEEFSIFYMLKGYRERAHSKEALYRILYDYISWKCRKLDTSREEAFSLLQRDLAETLNPEAVKNFVKRGWKIEERG